jgi:class I fructose-bisphosphate aldolase
MRRMMPPTARPTFITSAIEHQNHVLLLEYDLFHEPERQGQEDRLDPAQVLQLAEHGPFTGVALHKGLAARYYVPGDFSVPLVVMLNGMTERLPDHEPTTALLCDVDEALSLGARAVMYTLYLGSQTESRMLQEFSQIVRRAHECSLPVVLRVELWGAAASHAGHRDMLAYAARLALELGADYVRLHDTDSDRAREWVVESAGLCKVLIGLATDRDGAAKAADSIIQSGASGVSLDGADWLRLHDGAVVHAVGDVLFTP